MSIINEALKKTEQARKQNTQREVPGNFQKPFLAQPQIVKKAANKKPWQWLSFAFVIVIISLVVMIMAKHKNWFHKVAASASAVVAEITPTKTAPAKVAITPAVAIKNNTDPNLELNGTISEGSDQIAVINHQEYRVGDEIDGQKIIKILSYKVILQGKDGLTEIHTN